MSWIPPAYGPLRVENEHGKVDGVDGGDPYSLTHACAGSPDGSSQLIFGPIALGQKGEKSTGEEAGMLRHADIGIFRAGPVKLRSIGKASTDTQKSSRANVRKQRV